MKKLMLIGFVLLFSIGFMAIDKEGARKPRKMINSTIKFYRHISPVQELSIVSSDFKLKRDTRSGACLYMEFC